HMAGIIASSDRRNPGVAPGVDLITLRLMGGGQSGDFNDVETALQWVIEHAAQYNIASVNMSLGDGWNYDNPVSAYGLGDELAALANMGVTVVCAAGNAYDVYDTSSFGQQGVSYPAADPNALAIGAVYDADVGSVRYGGGTLAFSTDADRITPFSQRHREMTTVFAPGAPIVGAGHDGGTVTMHGTSQAAPHITGIVALAQQLAIRELGHRLSFDQIGALLSYTGKTIHDGDDEDDSTIKTGIDFSRVDMVDLAEGILAMKAPDNLHAVVLLRGKTAAQIDFADREIDPDPGAIHGTAFEDLDGDGIHDAEEPGIAGQKVYLDQNRNDWPDAGEPFRITDSNGTYGFEDLSPAVYTVAEAPQFPWEQTSPIEDSSGIQRVSLL
ncbi:hypothetical protein LCGC14_2916420, partial [marine sediment metagenome]